MIECACGCNQKLNEFDDRGRKRKYIVGHFKYWLGKKRDEKTNLKISKTLTGRKMPQSVREKISKSNMGRKNIGLNGKNSPHWKGGKFISTYGYVLIYVKDRGHIFEHRLIMENCIKRRLEDEEVVHHLNGIKTDNRIENLLLLANRAEHKKIHSDIGMKTRFVAK